MTALRAAWDAATLDERRELVRLVWSLDLDAPEMAELKAVCASGSIRAVLGFGITSSAYHQSLLGEACPVVNLPICPTCGDGWRLTCGERCPACLRIRSADWPKGPVT